ncbi:hypothetical protein TRFO_29085 [Tritrichomonas foetus]|uniref:Uncharacterized protein n=1 Tax=Tritrichomonas foetus TaxID=1144522 RepID=A0A1J4JX09_9EUKA|nr:hypothetical protein TRFO_29085 [Tritrichomonas foetus]|eukprot:OHT03531.1 hypothetical protein TRFO_29085 [Tritrichomonas foetus]
MNEKDLPKPHTSLKEVSPTTIQANILKMQQYQLEPASDFQLFLHLEMADLNKFVWKASKELRKEFEKELSKAKSNFRRYKNLSQICFHYKNGPAKTKARNQNRKLLRPRPFNQSLSNGHRPNKTFDVSKLKHDNRNLRRKDSRNEEDSRKNRTRQ